MKTPRPSCVHRKRRSAKHSLDAAVERIAEMVQKKLGVDTFRPLIREMTLVAELEREMIRRNGLGPSLVRGLRQAGINLSLDNNGILYAGPKWLIDHHWKSLLKMFRWELVCELNKEGAVRPRSTIIDGKRIENRKPGTNGVVNQVRK